MKGIKELKTDIELFMLEYNEQLTMDWEMWAFAWYSSFADFVNETYFSQGEVERLINTYRVVK